MRKSYRLLSGANNADGYVLSGSPTMVMDKNIRVAGQAVSLPEMFVKTIELAHQ